MKLVVTNYLQNCLSYYYCKKEGAFMAFFDFRIADKVYDVNDLNDRVNSNHDALETLSAEARL